MAGAAPVPEVAEVDLERVGSRIEQLLERIAATEPRVVDTVDDLVAELLRLYGTALGRILIMVDDLAPGVTARLTEDPLIAGLFALHDLHPVDVLARVEAALEQVRPYLGSHGGDVELVAVEGDVVRLQLKGSCNGCGASASTLEHAVEGAIRDAAPEIERIEVAGVVEAVAPDAHGLIPLSSLAVRRGGRP